MWREVAGMLVDGGGGVVGWQVVHAQPYNKLNATSRSNGDISKRLRGFLLLCWKQIFIIISFYKAGHMLLRFTWLDLFFSFFFSTGKVSGWGNLPGVCEAADQCGAVNVIMALWQSDNLPVCLSTLGKCTGILNVTQQTRLWVGNSVCVGSIMGWGERLRQHWESCFSARSVTNLTWTVTNILFSYKGVDN